MPGVNSEVPSAVSSASAPAVVRCTPIRRTLTWLRPMLNLAWEKLSFATVTRMPTVLTIADRRLLVRLILKRLSLIAPRSGGQW
jgi:hypothetical protein